MSLQVYNTLSKTKEPFEPVVPGKVGIYLCGPTVYRPSHIGHGVGPVIFDAIKRYLTHKGYEVRLVVNITDVDDKLIAEAAAQNVPMAELASRLTQSYFESLDALSVRSVDDFPRATDHIEQIIELVQRLVDKGAGYVVAGDVYFDHTQAVDYGKLSGRKVEQSLSGTRDVAGSSRHPADFALWKASKEGEPSWDSPWGPGRPGWHIECSAMSMALLGETFYIHGGGMDLIFPHHENEIAQSETATGRTYAKYWLHNGLTRVRTKAASGEWRDEKMSKSLGNIRTLTELLDRYDGETIRAFILGTHYRRPLDFSDEQLESTARAMSGFHRLFERLQRVTDQNVYEPGQAIHQLNQDEHTDAQRQLAAEAIELRLAFYRAMDDDFNTAGAIAALHDMAGTINRYIDDHRLEGRTDEVNKQLVAAAGRSLIDTGRILGLFERPAPARRSVGLESKLMELLIALRARARADKNFALADRIRDDLAAIGVTIEDAPGGTIWRME